MYFTDSIFTREHLCTFCSVIMSPTIHQIQIKGQRRGKAQRQTKPTFGGHNERMAEICASMLLCCLVGHSTKYSRGYDISHYVVDTVQDFLIKLGIKPCVHLWKISIFSLNHVIFRPTKIMNNLLKDCKIHTFKVIFQHQKSMESF